MKMKIYITLFLLLALNFVYAQVGIGTTSPNGALDVTSTTDGILIPRVALSATNVATITTPTVSELVYNTFTSAAGPNQVTPGFYYWDGSLWNKLAIGNTNNDWTLTGNTGTSAATNFLGTTDNVDLVFKRFNSRAGYIGNPTYDINFDFTNGNTSFGANSLLNPTFNFATQSGVRNTAIGVNVMPGLTSGRLNTGIGEFALFSNTSGITNTAIGSGSMFTNSSGNNNVAIGRQSLTNSNSDNNTAVGFASLRQNASGTNNTALGYEALRGVLGSGNVGVGYQAGRLETGSNKLYIENSNADANNALIYGDFGSSPKILRTNGQLQIGNPTVTGYAFPTSRGTIGQVLQTDGAGGTTWVAASTLTVTETDPQVSSATSSVIPKWNGTTLVDGVLTDDGTNVGVGVTPSAGNKLEVNGKTKTTDFQMTNGAADTYFLKSDASGNGSWATIPVNTVLPYTTTGAATGIYSISLTEYTVRVYNGVSEVRLPTAVGNTGKIFIIIGSNGIGSKTFSTSGGFIYDDVTNANISVINPNERYSVQSDGTDWIVIGR